MKDPKSEETVISHQKSVNNSAATGMWHQQQCIQKEDNDESKLL